MNSSPLLRVRQLTKAFVQGMFRKKTVFELNADFDIPRPTIVGMIGPNGAGKTTLLELIAGNHAPTTGQVICSGQNIHNVKYGERRFIVNHHRQAHQNYKFKQSRKPDFLLDSANARDPMIHLFDEPDMADWYIGLLFNKFRELKSQGHLVVFCVHPATAAHLELIRIICDEYIFVQDGSFQRFADFDALLGDLQVREYLGPIAIRTDPPL